MTYFLITQSFSRGLTAQDLSSLLARHLRVAVPEIRTEHIVQFPIVDGGEGMVESLVTLLLGSFLEVDATSANGGQVVAPIGFIGDDNNIALLRIGSVAGMDDHLNLHAGSESFGTTFGVGELIQDALDEGAHSIVLGLDEPIACDAGLGLAAALGVKFFDAEDRPLDLSKPIDHLLHKVAKIDATGRSFDVLSARFFVARSRRSFLRNDVRPMQKLLERLNEIVRRDCTTEVDLGTVDPNGCGIEFGLQAFFRAEIHEGSGLIFQSSGIEGKLKEIAESRIVIAAESLDAVFGKEAFDAMSKVIALSDELKIPISILVASVPDPESVLAQRVLHPSFESCFALRDAALFLAPLESDASDEAIRRDQRMRIDALAPKLFSPQVATSATHSKRNAATSNGTPKPLFPR